MRKKFEANLVILLLCHFINNGCSDLEKNRGIDGISKQMLTKQLRELEADGILERKIYAEIPPRVEYFMTDLGNSLLPVIEQMKQWGRTHMEKA